MKWNSVAVAALGLFEPTNALLRFGCARLTVQRLDPLVNPGQNPSTHLHQIIGGVSTGEAWRWRISSLIAGRTLSMSPWTPPKVTILSRDLLAQVASSLK